MSFDRNSEPYVYIEKSRRYAHQKCYEENQETYSQEELDYKELEDYIKKLFNKNVVPARVKKQIKDYKEEYGYTSSGILKTLYWWYELKNNSTEKANEGIGIVPFIYDDAKDYYYRLYLAQIANNLINENIPKPVVQEIEIGSPRVRTDPIKLFDFEDED
jgi:hypothetical protein